MIGSLEVHTDPAEDSDKTRVCKIDWYDGAWSFYNNEFKVSNKGNGWKIPDPAFNKEGGAIGEVKVDIHDLGGK